MANDVIIRKPIRYMSYNKRYLGLNSLEMADLRKLGKILEVTAALWQLSKVKHQKMQDVRTERVVKRYRRLLIVSGLTYYNTIVIPKNEIPAALPIVHLGRTIESFTDEECYNNLRFRKEDLHRLLRCFRLENKQIKLSNRTIISGEEIMLFSLHRRDVYVRPQHQIHDDQ
jgi:hypothetical protein